MSASSNEPAVRPLATVGALIVDDRGRGLFVRSPKWLDTWAVPGGKIEWGESLRSALLRECLEETGLRIRDVRWAPTLEHVRSPDFSKDAHFVLLNFFAHSDDDRVVLDDEATDHVWMRPDEALQALELNAPTRRLVLSYLSSGGHGTVLAAPTQRTATAP